MTEERTVVATLLVRLPRNQEEIDSWFSYPEAQSHPGDIGNLWLMKCYSNEQTLENLETLMGLPGVQDVVVAYGDVSWPEYAETHKIELKKHVCTRNGCEGSGGSALMGEVLYYTGPL
jgi:hypothetical protein